MLKIQQSVTKMAMSLNRNCLYPTKVQLRYSSFKKPPTVFCPRKPSLYNPKSLRQSVRNLPMFKSRATPKFGMEQQCGTVVEKTKKPKPPCSGAPIYEIINNALDSWVNKANALFMETIGGYAGLATPTYNVAYDFSHRVIEGGPINYFQITHACAKKYRLKSLDFKHDRVKKSQCPLSDVDAKVQSRPSDKTTPPEQPKPKRYKTGVESPSSEESERKMTLRRKSNKNAKNKRKKVNKKDSKEIDREDNHEKSHKRDAEQQTSETPSNSKLVDCSKDILKSHKQDAKQQTSETPTNSKVVDCSKDKLKSHKRDAEQQTSETPSNYSKLVDYSKDILKSHKQDAKQQTSKTPTNSKVVDCSKVILKSHKRDAEQQTLETSFNSKLEPQLNTQNSTKYVIKPKNKKTPKTS
ncbi:uncharacterized protein LOC126837178 [Adelges cooleyi]|uniref:uncharacterized protein LOC126837178 n=1 Tax=Adelges cooleyi TaxID=133065 RepID=UPI002180713B|nr:uncharacterized protein LOC126837178 [Adelges cooleyi]